MNNIYAVYRKLTGKVDLFGNSTENVQFTGNEASKLLIEQIQANKPLMVARFGANELNAILNYYFIKDGLKQNIKNLINGIPYFLKYRPGIVRDMNVGAGFFPATSENLDRFAKMAFEDITEIDILGSWLKQEQFLFRYMKPDSRRIRLRDLTPFRQENPWTEALAGKKVLVVHPFEDAIQAQYKKRELLFKDPRVLPEFQLTTLKAVQSAGENETVFTDWFAALDYMTDEIAKRDFDIALLGCGAYGLPLAARIKRMGKQAVHVGGVLQCMFGIKGARWEGAPYNFQDLFYNDAWIRPYATDKPKGSEKIEGACYW